MNSNNIILIGMMGAGKSVVGRLLAEKLQRPFCDVDSCIEKTAGVSIADIFENEGEGSFRKRERETLAYVLGIKEQVIATGGGAVMDEDNVFKMREGGQVVYLSAPVELLAKRVNAEGATARPLLANGNAEEAIKSLLAQRATVYHRAAHVVVEQTAEDKQTQVADRVLAALEAAWTSV